MHEVVGERLKGLFAIPIGKAREVVLLIKVKRKTEDMNASTPLSAHG